MNESYSVTIIYAFAAPSHAGGMYETAEWLNKKIKSILKQYAADCEDEEAVEAIVITIGAQVQIYRGKQLRDLVFNGIMIAGK